MKSLLAFFYNNFGFVYLEPSYRLTDSETTGSAVDRASLTITGPQLTIRLINERTTMQCVVAPTQNIGPKNWFWIELIRQFLDGIDATTPVSAKELATWCRRKPQPSGGTSRRGYLRRLVRAALSEMRLANAIKEFGRPKNL